MAPRDHTPAPARATAARMIRRAVSAATLVLALTATPASALQLAPDTPHSPNAEDLATTYWVMLAITLLVAVLVNTGLVLALVRFRARRGRVPSRITAGRGVIARVMGGFGVLAVAIFVFGVIMSDSARTVEASGPEGLTAATARTAQVPVKGVSAAALEASDAATLGQEPPSGETSVFVPEEGDPLVISAIAQQWLWRFEYPGGVPGQRTFSYGELVVPVDTAVVLSIDSTDVIHSWWVPALGGQVQAVPGSLAQTWFKADEVGTYEGRGTVFDGPAFPAMTASVRVVEAEEYQSYVEGLAEDLAEAQSEVRDEVAATAAAEAAAEGAP